MLTVEHLTKTFLVHQLNGKKIHGFDDISFRVAQGRALGIAGPSGIGKSSLLKCIYGTYIPDSGQVRYQSRQLGVIDMVRAGTHEMIHLRHTEIGYVTQFLQVLPRVSALNIVADPLVERGVARDDARDRARVILERLNIPKSHYDAYPVTFSGGEKQRINLARAVISRPRLLLLDEPTASLDPESMRIVLDILNELKQSGSTMVAIFHDRDILNRFADDVFDMPNRRRPGIGTA